MMVDERLIDFLTNCGSDIFYSDPGIPISSEEKIEIIISQIAKFCAEKNEIPIKKRHPNSRSGKSYRFCITLSDMSYEYASDKRSSMKEIIKRVFSLRVKDYKLYQILAALIIAMLSEANIYTLLLPEVNKEDALLDFSNPSQTIVSKLTEWLLFDNLSEWLSMNPSKCNSITVREEFCRLFPHTYRPLFHIKNGSTFSLKWMTDDGWAVILEDDSLYDDFNEQLLNTSSLIYFKKLEQELRKAASKHIIYGYLVNKASYDSTSPSRAIEVLKKNCTIIVNWINDGFKVNFNFDPMVIETIQEIECSVCDICKGQDSYTISDVKLLLGLLADMAKNTNHVIQMSESVYSLIGQVLSVEDTFAFGYPKKNGRHDDVAYLKYVKITVNHIISLLEEKKIVVRKGKTVSFAYKDYRLICEGMLIAKGYNKHGISLAQSDLISLYLSGDSEHHEKDHMNLHFNRYVLLLTAVLYFLNEDAREVALRTLIRIADDFSVKNRHNQVKAIYIISYYLCYGSSISSSLRKRAFDASFGTNIYEFQLREVQERLILDQKGVYNKPDSICDENKSFFIRTIKESLTTACILDEDQFAISDPLYIFWGGFLEHWRTKNNPPLNFLSEALKMQKEIWRIKRLDNKKLDVILCGKICKQIIKALSVMQEHLSCKNNDILGYVYASQILFYSLADIANFHGCKNEFLMWIKQKGFTGQLIKCCILSDYLNRKYNRYYNQCNLNDRKMFLLCGSFRFVCAYSFDITEYSPVVLSDDMCSDYDKWYHNEQQTRYKALLYRLLSYTNKNIYEWKMEFENGDFPDWKGLFLPYDNISDYQTFVESPHILDFSI